MRAVVCTRYGPPEVLQLRDLPVPAPGAHEVRIRVSATAVTSSDCYVRGLRLSPAYRLAGRIALGWSAPRRPVLGMVLSGEVDAVGTAVRTFAPGDSVFGLNQHRFGAYAQFVCWSQDALLVPRPAGLTHEQAAALPYGGLLAHHVLRAGGATAGQRVLIYGASGAVGTSVVQLARLLDCRVTGVCGPANLPLVASLGATTVVDYTTEALADLPERYDLVVDAVGRHKSRAALRQCRPILAPGGRIVSVDDGTPRLRREDLVSVAALAAGGQLRPVIDRVVPLDDIVEAHRYVDTGHKRGNVIVAVS